MNRRFPSILLPGRRSTKSGDTIGCHNLLEVLLASSRRGRQGCREAPTARRTLPPLSPQAREPGLQCVHYFAPHCPPPPACEADTVESQGHKGPCRPVGTQPGCRWPHGAQRIWKRRQLWAGQSPGHPAQLRDELQADGAGPLAPLASGLSAGREQPPFPREEQGKLLFTATHSLNCPQAFTGCSYLPPLTSRFPSWPGAWRRGRKRLRPLPLPAAPLFEELGLSNTWWWLSGPCARRAPNTAATEAAGRGVSAGGRRGLGLGWGCVGGPREPGRGAGPCPRAGSQLL